MVVGCDSDHLLGSNSEPWVQKQDRDNEKQADESGTQSVDCDSLMEVVLSELLGFSAGRSDGGRVVEVPVRVLDPL